MLSDRIRNLLEIQVNEELYSAYLYLGFANNLKFKGLEGFSHWYEIQAREEVDHAMLIRDYLINSNEKVELKTIGTEKTGELTVHEIMIKGLKHEEHVTDLINKIYSEAINADDYRTRNFLEWFIAEQAEEEINAHELLAKYEVYGVEAQGLYSLNRELSKREYEAPDV